MNLFVRIRTLVDRLAVLNLYHGGTVPFGPILARFDATGCVRPTEHPFQATLANVKRYTTGERSWLVPKSIVLDGKPLSVVAWPYHPIGTGTLVLCVCYDTPPLTQPATVYWGIVAVAYDAARDTVEVIGTYPGESYDRIRPDIVPERLKHRT